MADVNLSSGHQSTMVTIDTGSGSDQLDEAPAKKMRKLFEKTDLSNTNEKGMKAMERLENRLGGILCCAVCLDLPNSAVFQVHFHSLILDHIIQEHQLCCKRFL